MVSSLNACACEVLVVSSSNKKMTDRDALGTSMARAHGESKRGKSLQVCEQGNNLAMLDGCSHSYTTRPIEIIDRSLSRIEHYQKRNISL